MKNIKVSNKHNIVCYILIIFGIALLVGNSCPFMLFFEFLTGVNPFDNKSYIRQIIPYLNNYSKLIGLDDTTIAENNIIDDNLQEPDNITIDHNDEILPDSTVITYENVHKLKTMTDLSKFMYIIDKGTYVKDEELLPINKLLDTDISIDLNGSAPRILIFHTHSYEAYTDSRDGYQEDTIYGVGETLTNILKTKYNLPVLHDNREYDIDNGIVEYGYTYELVEPYIQKILKKNPSIEILIDLHRDGVPANLRLVTEINGKQTAKIMFVNGISRVKSMGDPVDLINLPNPFNMENLAFSLKMKLAANELHPDFARKNYIKPYRYSLNMMPRSLLVEVGADTNTVAEAKNAMEPLADSLVKVLTKN